MKTKLRKITVNDKQYFWKVDQDYYGVYLTVFQNKIIIFNDRIYSESVTPKVVRQVILGEYDSAAEKTKWLGIYS